MAYTTINKSTEHFDTKVYTGNGSSQTLDMDNLGLLWMKNRTEGSNHNLFDVVRGGYYASDPGPNLRPNGTTAGHGSDITSAYGITFGSSSSTIGSDGGGYNYNQNGKSYVGWQWRANGTGSANTDGTINSTVSANTTSGFSIVKYTGTGSAATVGHGLGVAPKLIITKNLDRGSEAWPVDCRAADGGNGGIMYLNETGTLGSYGATSPYNNTAPTTSVYSIGSPGNTNYSGSTLISYCFAEKKGFSKFGEFAGNGESYGTFVYTGFKPHLVIIKRHNVGTSDWVIQDNKRPGYNPAIERLFSSNSDATSSSTGGSTTGVDFVSNGFHLKDNSTNAFATNISGSKYIYLAFGQSLVGTNNVPVNAG